MSRREDKQGGFTLVELLVVIVILGILSAIVVFAVRGVGNKGEGAAFATDKRTIRTALEVFCAKNDRYPGGPGQWSDNPMGELVAGKYLSDASDYHSLATADTFSPPAVPEGKCPGTPRHYTLTEIRQPVNDLNPNGYSTIAGGRFHSLAVKDGEVVAWGNNQYGQLGDGTTTSSSKPVELSGLSGVTALAAGYAHSLALKDGKVYAWGLNQFGQLGNGTTTNSSTPVEVIGLASVKAIAAESNGSLALTEDGTVWSWGWTGNNNSANSPKIPVPVSDPSDPSGLLSGITGIAAGTHHALALKGGTVWAWGWNSYGQLGNGVSTGNEPSNNTPVQVIAPGGGFLSGVTAIVAGSGHSMALKAGTAWAWGANGHGQLGDGTTTNRSTPVQVADPSGGFFSGATAISAGQDHSLALKGDKAWAWGDNGAGQLGDGTTTNRSTPVQVSLGSVFALAGGAAHSLAITTDRKAWAWGLNNHGQLGDGTTTSRTTPVEVAPASLVGLPIITPPLPLPIP